MDLDVDTWLRERGRREEAVVALLVQLLSEEGVRATAACLMFACEDEARFVERLGAAALLRIAQGRPS